MTQETTNIIIQSLSILVAIVTFLTAHIVTKSRDRKTANRETYQNLELASIDLFRFEAAHLEVIRPIWEESAIVPESGTAEHMVTSNYLCQMLNLFEIAINLRKEKVLPPKVFASWIPWYYTVANSPHFEEFWSDLVLEYTSDLRAILNKAVEDKKSETDEDTRQEKLFSFVAKILNCKEINEFYTSSKKDQFREHANQKHKESSEVRVVKGDQLDIEVEWCSDVVQSKIFTQFISENIDVSYISHSEIQYGRAQDLNTWSNDLFEILEADVVASLNVDEDENSIRKLACARSSGELVCIMMIDIMKSQFSTFAILQDMVVSRKYRSQRVGDRCIKWLEIQLKNDGINRLFLESGRNNEKAHHFFKSQGFEQSSVVMLKDL